MLTIEYIYLKNSIEVLFEESAAINIRCPKLVNRFIIVDSTGATSTVVATTLDAKEICSNIKSCMVNFKNLKNAVHHEKYIQQKINVNAYL